MHGRRLALGRDVEYGAGPRHGPIFRKDNSLLDQAIARLNTYLHMADFGTCAIDWPLLEQWDVELAEGRLPG